MLLEKGADVNTTDGNGRTALWTASWNGHTKIVSMLLEKGADANTTDGNGRTALWMASMNGYTDIVNMLLNKGADRKTDDGTGRTALMMANMNGYTDIVSLLAGQEIENAKNKGSLSVIQNATRSGKVCTKNYNAENFASPAQLRFFNLDKNTGPTVDEYLDTNPNDEWFDRNTLRTKNKNKNGGKKTKKRKTRKSNIKNRKTRSKRKTITKRNNHNKK
jgi:hypothetical protein